MKKINLIKVSATFILIFTIPFLSGFVEFKATSKPLIAFLTSPLDAEAKYFKASSSTFKVNSFNYSFSIFIALFNAFKTSSSLKFLNSNIVLLLKRALKT